MEDIDQKQTTIEKKAESIKVPNDYEKVIIAAKVARKINNQRIAAREHLAPEEIAKIEQRKVTSIALKDVENGKVRFLRQKEEREEETYDLT
jgi:DNA-directed RNA polymerase omega subunit